MELLSGHRAELLELAALVRGWRRGGGAWDPPPTPPKWERGGSPPPLPPREPGGAGPWVLHALPNARLGVALPAGGAGPCGDPLGADVALTLGDLRRTLTFVSLEDEDEEEEEGAAPPGRLLVVRWVLLLADARGLPLGLDYELGSPRAPPAPPPAPRALGLLCRAMGRPMAGGPPRRPRLLAVGDAGLRAALAPLVARLGVALVGTPKWGWGPPPTLDPPALTSRLCHQCGGLAGTPQPCAACRAVLFCSARCAALALRGGHRGRCRQLRALMGGARALQELPFHFTPEVTGESFALQRFLGARGLSGGGWAALSMWVRPPDYGVGLGGGAPHPGPPRDSWAQYYAWRGLPLSSPLAALLSYPLTLFYVLTRLLPQSFPELRLLRRRRLRVEVEESGAELGLLGLFWELSVLLPHVTLELLFLGGSVPPPLHGRRFRLQRTEVLELFPGSRPSAEGGGGGRGGVHVTFSARPPPGTRPDLVIGFNAGFALQEPWVSALPRLQAQRVPAFFSVGSALGVPLAGAAAGAAAGGGAGPPVLNPFRCPLRRPGLDNNLPWFANAFLFQLLYKGGAPPPPPPPAPPRPSPSPPEPRPSRRPPRRSRRR
ncbi:zinc finger MYND domain-containing protein 15 isoform X2 [Patagioenas fasciata]|uniref:zinc finger MYND domain-containing protein 15 isoform X2 n=1 Tax=Patagioenas fasciata TaxID=372321 RepID=UPI003A991909